MNLLKKLLSYVSPLGQLDPPSLGTLARFGEPARGSGKSVPYVNEAFGKHQETGHPAVARTVFGVQFHPRFDFIAEHKSYHSLDQWFSTGGNCTPQGTSGDIWGHFGCHHCEERGDAAGT